MDRFIIFFISMFIHGYNALSCRFLNTPKISLPVSLLTPTPLIFLDSYLVFFTFFVIIDIAPVHIR